jgi:hypothetical protein
VLERLRPREGGALFGIVIGFVLGVLAAVVIVPRRQDTVRVNQPGAAGPNGTVATGDGPLDTTGGTGIAPSGAAGTGTTGTGAGGSTVTGGTSGPGGAAPGSGTTGGSSGGGTGTSGGGTTGGGSSGGGSGTVTDPGGPVRGVTATTIKIGVAYPDISALRALGPEYNNGDVPKQWNALLDGWRRAGIDKINGRAVQFVYRSYAVLDANDQNAACRAFIEDDKVFMVIGVAYFQTGSECVARQFHTPLLTTDGPPEGAYARGAPYLFSIQMSDSRLLRNWIHWAHARGWIKGHRIGVYYLDDPATAPDIEKNVIDEARKLGGIIAATATTHSGNGGPEDGAAAQKFQAATVDVALLMTSKGGFLQQAQAIRYKPRFIETDHAFGTSDVTTSNYPADEYDGTYGMTGRLIGEGAAGMPQRPDSEACIRNYERFAKTTLPRPGKGGHQTAEYGYVLFSCDLGEIMQAALHAAGARVSFGSYVQGMRSISNMQLSAFAPVDYRTRNDGGNQQRTVLWTKSCTCWKAVGSFGPMFVP